MSKNNYDLPGHIFYIDNGSHTQGILQDVNGDGIPDYSAANNNGSRIDNYIWLGNIEVKNDGVTHVYYLKPEGPNLAKLPKDEYIFDMDKKDSERQGILIDLNGDGIADFTKATRWKNGNTKLEIYLGNSNGRFNDHSSGKLDDHIFYIDNGSHTQGILQDVNGDGIPDYSHAYNDERGFGVKNDIYLGSVDKNSGEIIYLNSNNSGTIPKLPNKEYIFLIRNNTEIKSPGILQDLNGDG